MLRRIAEPLSNVGFAFMILGVLIAIPYFFGYNLGVLILAADRWDPLAGWGIPLGLVIAGVILGHYFHDIAQAVRADEANRSAVAERNFRRLKKMGNHPRLQQFLSDISQNMKVTFDETTDPDVYVIKQILWQDASRSYLDQTTNLYYGPDDPRVTNVSLYLERQNEPRRLVANQDFATRQISLAQPDPATWAGLVGY